MLLYTTIQAWIYVQKEIWSDYLVYHRVGSDFWSFSILFTSPSSGRSFTVFAFLTSNMPTMHNFAWCSKASNLVHWLLIHSLFKSEFIFIWPAPTSAISSIKVLSTEIKLANHETNLGIIMDSKLCQLLLSLAHSYRPLSSLAIFTSNSLDTSDHIRFSWQNGNCLPPSEMSLNPDSRAGFFAKTKNPRKALTANECNDRVWWIGGRSTTIKMKVQTSVSPIQFLKSFMWCDESMNELNLVNIRLVSTPTMNDCTVSSHKKLNFFRKQTKLLKDVETSPCGENLLFWVCSLYNRPNKWVEDEYVQYCYNRGLGVGL